MRVLAPTTLLLASVSLGACSTPGSRRRSATTTRRSKAVLSPDPPKPVRIVEIPKLLPLPGQLKPIPGAKTEDAEAADPRARVDQANGEARVQPTRAGYHQRHPGLSLLGRRALPGLCRARRDHRHRARSRRAACRLGSGRRRRHRAMDDRRHRERNRSVQAGPHPGQADPAGSRHQPRRQHRPAHLSSRAALGRKDLHGLGVLGLCAATSSSRCAGRTRLPRPRRRSRPASTSMR